MDYDKQLQLKIMTSDRYRAQAQYGASKGLLKKFQHYQACKSELQATMTLGRHGVDLCY